MKIKNIHEGWGTIVELDEPHEVFAYDRSYWQDLIYSRHLVVFKRMNFTLEDYAKFGHLWGRAWSGHEYRATHEIPITVNSRENLHVSEFSNKLVTKITNEEMMWHADIPNKAINPFPHRALWIVKNPNGHISGKTRWININLDECGRYLKPHQLDLLERVKIIQQSWYKPGTEIGTHDFIKTHPITGRKSLRLNAYCDSKTGWNNLWIKNVVIDGVEQPDCSLIADFIDTLKEVPELHYEHQWDDWDIALYDNWSFIHGRSKLILDEDNNERKFYRMNIDHLLLKK